MAATLIFHTPSFNWEKWELHAPNSWLTIKGLGRIKKKIVIRAGNLNPAAINHIKRASAGNNNKSKNIFYLLSISPDAIRLMSETHCFTPEGTCQYAKNISHFCSLTAKQKRLPAKGTSGNGCHDANAQN
jgi:hypothetical protein